MTIGESSERAQSVGQICTQAGASAPSGAKTATQRSAIPPIRRVFSTFLAGLLAAVPAKVPKGTDNPRLAECGEGRNSRKQPLIERHVVIIYIYGFVACLMYGFILNAWSILSFYHAQASGLAGILLVYATALPFDVTHGVATVVFLVALYAPWRRKLRRIKSKYGME